MNKYIIEISAPKLVGKVIRVGTACRDRLWYGVITDVLYGLVIPTDEQMATVYGEDWKEKPCKSAQKAIDYDRVNIPLIILITVYTIIKERINFFLQHAMKTLLKL